MFLFYSNLLELLRGELFELRVVRTNRNYVIIKVRVSSGMIDPTSPGGGEGYLDSIQICYIRTPAYGCQVGLGVM